MREVTELADEEDLQEATAEDRGLWGILYGLSSFGFSMMVHLAGMVLLAFLTVPPPIRPDQTTMEAAFSPLIEDEPVEVELEKDFQLVTDSSLTLFSSAPRVGAAGELQGSAGAPQLDARVLEQADAEAELDEIHIEYPLASAPASSGWSRRFRMATSRAIRGPSSMTISRPWIGSRKS